MSSGLFITDAGASTSTIKGGQVGVKHIIQHMHEVDLDYTTESAPFWTWNLWKEM